MMPFLRQVFLFLVALAALAIVLMMIKTADAAELKQGSDGTRQIVVEASTQDKGAAATDLTAESAAVPADTLAAEEPTPEASKPEASTDEAELTDREALALAHLYALYLSAAHQGHSVYGHGYSYDRGYGQTYDHCDD
jgi:hypothetical protein